MDTNKESSAVESPVVEVLDVGMPRRRWWSGRQTVTAPKPEASAWLVARTTGGEAAAGLRQVPGEEQGRRIESAEPVEFLSVRREPVPLELVLAGALAADEQGAWDAMLAGTVQVGDPVRFAQACALGLVSPGSPLSAEMLASWLVRRLAVEARDWVRISAEGFTSAEFRDQDVLPVSLWTDWCNERLAESGVQVSWEKLDWENAEAARAEAEQRQTEELERVEAAKQREREAELRELAAQTSSEQRRQELEAGHAEKLRQLENDEALSESARQLQREMLEREQQLLLQQADAEIERQQLKAEAEAETARREAERAVWDHLLGKAAVEEKIAAANARAANAPQTVGEASAHEAELRRLELEERRETSRLKRELLAREQEQRVRQMALENRAREETLKLELEQLAQKAERLRLEHRKLVEELRLSLEAARASTSVAGGRDYSISAMSAVRGGGAQGQICSACGKTILTASDVLGACAAPGCEGIFCNACWNTGTRRCRQHAGI